MYSNSHCSTRSDGSVPKTERVISFFCSMTFVISLVTMLVSHQAHADTVYEYLQADKVYSYFAGTTNVPNATVRINEAVGTTNSDGSFGFHAKKAERYAISVSKVGYALSSQITSQPSTVLSFTLKKAEVISLSVDDLVKGVTVQDSRKTQIQLPPNAFGDSVNEPVNAYVYTYDTANEAMPGDMSVANRDGYLETAGVFSAEFVGTSGKKYNLVAGKEATISLPAVSITDELPGLWHYDEVTGKWEEGNSSSVNLVNGRLQGKVGHFSTWNFDWYKRNPACLKIDALPSFFSAYSYGSNPLVKVSVKSTTYGTRVSQGQLRSVDPTLSIINIPPDSLADIYVQAAITDINGNKINTWVLLAQNISVGAGGGCNGRATLEGKPIVSFNSVNSFAAVEGAVTGTAFSWALVDSNSNGTIIGSSQNDSLDPKNLMSSAMQLFMKLSAFGVGTMGGDWLSLGTNVLYVGAVSSSPIDSASLAQMCQVTSTLSC